MNISSSSSVSWRTDAPLALKRKPNSNGNNNDDPFAKEPVYSFKKVIKDGVMGGIAGLAAHGLGGDSYVMSALAGAGASGVAGFAAGGAVGAIGNGITENGLGGEVLMSGGITGVTGAIQGLAAGTVAQAGSSLIAGALGIPPVIGAVVGGALAGAIIPFTSSVEYSSANQYIGL